MDPDCIFCRIAAGQDPAEIVYRDGRVTAFRDVRPQAPVHVLVVPNVHVASLAELDDAALAGQLVIACRDVARAEGLERGYRVVANVGRHAGLVPHLHLHVLGGRRLGWPPG